MAIGHSLYYAKLLKKKHNTFLRCYCDCLTIFFFSILLLSSVENKHARVRSPRSSIKSNFYLLYGIWGTFACNFTRTRRYYNNTHTLPTKQKKKEFNNIIKRDGLSASAPSVIQCCCCRSSAMLANACARVL